MQILVCILASVFINLTFNKINKCEYDHLRYTSRAKHFPLIVNALIVNKQIVKIITSDWRSQSQ